MKHKKTFIAGLIGTGYLDFVLIPVLAVFLGLTFYAYSKYEKSHKNKKM